MVSGHLSIRFTGIQLCWLSVLKQYLTFKMITEFPTTREFILLVMIYRVHPKNHAIMGINIYILYPTNNNYVWIYMQYLPRIMKTNIQQHNGIQYTKMDCHRFGVSTFWCVDVLVCRRFGLSTFWSVDVLVCWRFVLSTFWFVDVLVCWRFGLSTFWFVDVSVCRRFGLSTFRSVDVSVVDVSVCRRFDQLPLTWPASIAKSAETAFAAFTSLSIFCHVCGT